MTSALERQPLGQLLLCRGVVAPAQLDVALATQRRGPVRKLLGEILVESRLCTDAQIAEALAASFGVPFVRVHPRLADPKVLSALPREFIEREQVLPLFLVDGVLTVAVVEPSNLFLLDEVGRLTGHKVQAVATTAGDIAATLRAYLPDDGVFAGHEVPEEPQADAFSLNDDRGEASGAASGVGRLVRTCLYAAVRESATDVHLEPCDGYSRVRYRVDGKLLERTRLPPQTYATFVAELKSMAGIAVAAAAAAAPADGVIRARVDGRPMEFRLSVAPVALGVKAVVRLGDQAKSPMRLEKLGFGYEPLKQWRKLIAASRGLLVVTGPAGSGKRTTLRSSVGEVNTAERNVCSVEDRRGRPLPGVNEFRADHAAGYDRAMALQALLAQDPDVVMLPDVSERDVARSAAGAAMAGRLVVCSLHAPDPAAVVSRLLALGVEPYVLGSALAGVLNQRLVRRLCPQCRESRDATPTEQAQLAQPAGQATTIYRAKGCAACRGNGFAGRIALFELLVATEPLADAIASGATRRELLSLVHPRGLKTLKEDGVDKVKSGIITLDDFVACA